MRNKLILGTAQIGLPYGITNDSSKIIPWHQAEELLDFAYDSNILELDTAESYGVAHSRIGRFHKSSRKKFKINTKLKFFGSTSDFDRKIDELLKTLDVDYLNLLMVHSVVGEIRNLSKYKQIAKDRIQTFGLSIYEHKELEKYTLEDINSVQLPFNLFDNSKRKASTLNFLQERKIAIHARSIFLQGILLDNNSPSRIFKAIETEIEHLKNIIGKDLKLEEMAFCYPLLKSEIDKVLFGVLSKTQLKQNLGMLDKLSTAKEHLKYIDSFETANSNLLDPRNWP